MCEWECECCCFKGDVEFCINGCQCLGVGKYFGGCIVVVVFGLVGEEVGVEGVVDDYVDFGC